MMNITLPEVLGEQVAFETIEKGATFIGHEEDGVMQLFLKTVDVEMGKDLLANAVRIGGENGGYFASLAKETMVVAVKELIAK